MGTAVLLVAVGALGLRVLAQANDRVGRLGPLQERAGAYGKLQSDTAHVRFLLAENVGQALYKVWPGAIPTGPGAIGRVAVDQALANQLRGSGPRPSPTGSDSCPPPKTSVSCEIRGKSGRLLTVVEMIIESERAKDEIGLRDRAEQLARNLNQLATELSNATTAKADDLIAQNAGAYAS